MIFPESLSNNWNWIFEGCRGCQIGCLCCMRRFGVILLVCVHCQCLQQEFRCLVFGFYCRHLSTTTQKYRCLMMPMFDFKWQYLAIYTNAHVSLIHVCNRNVYHTVLLKPFRRRLQTLALLAGTQPAPALAAAHMQKTNSTMPPHTIQRWLLDKSSSVQVWQLCLLLTFVVRSI